MTPAKVNLGCGQFPKPDFVNIDCQAGAGVDIVHDLNRLPWPVESQSIDLITADHLIEHLDDVMAVMAECYRILKPQGILEMKVPHFSRGFTHHEHKHGFDVTFPYYFDPDFPGGAPAGPGKMKFKCLDSKLHWFSEPHLKRWVMANRSVKLLRIAGNVIDSAANLSPRMCSRAWCYYVGGFEEIFFRFQKLN